jgi:hypothetical protein
MKSSLRRLTPLLLMLLCAHALHGQQLTVINDDGAKVVFDQSAIARLPHVKLTAGSSPAPSTFEGVALRSILEKAGIGFGDTLKGKRLASFLLASGADGFRVVIALPELDPSFTDKQVVLAFLQDGKPLAPKEGPFRIVMPDEKRMSRWVKQVTTLTIVDAQ